MDQDKIGQFIKNIRKQNNLTQQQFAEKLGVTFQAVSKWENGKNIPDIAILKQISKSFNIDINDILDGRNSNKKKKFQKSLIILFIVFGIIIVALLYFLNNRDYEFKTLSSDCKNFNISGVIAYNKEKSSIYISRINYCGGDDKNKYKNIECTLYETNGNMEVKIDQCRNVIQEDETLEDYLKDVQFNIDKYTTSCKSFKEAKLYLQINATDNSDRIITYKVPIKLNEKCSNN